MKLVKGNELNIDQKRRVLAAFVHRWTFENRQRVANSTVFISPDDSLLVSDEQWLAKHAFYITDSGNLSNVHKHCEPAYYADEYNKRNQG